MARASTAGELTLFRSEGQWSKLYMAVLVPNVIYTARLAALPGSNDQVYEITYNTGSGTLGDVKAGMMLYVGTSAGAYDLGFCRVRVAPDATKIYIGETSEINWQSNAYLTIVDDHDLHPRHIHVDENGGLLMDVNIPFVDQHSAFDPVPVLGSHAVAWLTGTTVDVDFDASDSWVFDSTISSYAWTAPGSSGSSGMTTATPTVTYNAPGIYRVYCVVTSATGKTTTGIRYVFVYDDDNPPATVFQIANCEGSVDSGGWMFDVTMQAEASLTEIRERTLVVLFAKDYYDGTEQSIGPIAGRENVIAVGRVGPNESIRWDPVAGQVHFTVYGPHYWLNRIKVSACQLNFSQSPTDWDQVLNLTVDRGLWHLLHWRSTATTIMDFYRTTDTRYADKLFTLANYLWMQLIEFAGLNLMAHVLCDRYGRLFAEIDPQMVPAASRTWPTVMTVTKDDWMDVIDLERATAHETGQVNITTRVVNSSGVSATLYSLSPGHIPKKYGEWELNDGLLAASQAGSNQMAGLLLGWRINPFPNIPLKMPQNNRMIDICPRQFLDITIDAADTPRGVGYDGNLIPRRVTLKYDSEARWLSTEVYSEGETFEQISANGDIPGSGDVDLSFPPIPGLPDLPEIPDVIPGTTEPSVEGPTAVLIHSSTYGFLYTSDFYAASPTWATVNAGLTQAQYQGANMFLVCPNGAFYAARLSAGSNLDFIARAPSIGATFEIIEDSTTITAKEGGTLNRVHAMGHNPLAAESVCYVLQGASGGGHAYIGAAGSYAQGYAFTNLSSTAPLGSDYHQHQYRLSYGFGNWVLHGWSTAGGTPQVIYRLNAGATGIVSQVQIGGIGSYNVSHRAGTTGKFSMVQSSPRQLHSFDNNDASSITVVSTDADLFNEGFGVDLTGMAMMTRYGAGLRGRSSDGGATWAGIPNLAFANNYHFAHAGSTARWIAAGGGNYVEYTSDFGNAWTPKTGNLASILLTGPSTINMARVVSY